MTVSHQLYLIVCTFQVHCMFIFITCTTDSMFYETCHRIMLSEVTGTIFAFFFNPNFKENVGKVNINFLYLLHTLATPSGCLTHRT